MALALSDFSRALAGRPLPTAVVDLDAFDRNLARHLETLPKGVPLRVATKSIRVAGLLRRLFDRGEGRLRGLMCYSLREAAALVARGFDDLLVAYPHISEADLDLYAGLRSAGANVSLAVDSDDGARRMSAVAERHGVRMRAVLCVDMSLRPANGLLHLGVRRSPLHSVEQVLALADSIRALPGLELHGVLGYEAQVAGLGDDSPYDSPLVRAGKRLVRAASMAEIKTRRSSVARRLADRGFELAFVNGGGTGSLDLTGPENGVSEITTGSGFYKPLLFDGYKSAFVKSLEPAAFFALEVTRKPSPDRATCLGGGYVASGRHGPDKLPRPHLPEGLRLVDAEGAGEVQTPLEGATTLSIGDIVVFRHAKAGELMERFNEVVLLQGGVVSGTLPTYRGEGLAFL
jgi:D-serine deaminase-like pyridoxal phosphate-dependent protein